jgi:hypothetical protein
MKQKILLISILFSCLFSEKSNALTTVIPLFDFGNTIKIGQIDTVARWKMTADSIGGQFVFFTSDHSGSVPDLMISNLNLRKDTSFFSIFPLLNVNTNISGTLNPNDTVIFTLTAKIDSLAPIGDTVKFGIAFFFNSPPTFISTVWSQKMTVIGSRLKIAKDTTVSNATITLGTGKLLASYDCIVEGVDSFHTVYALISNTGNCPTIACKNVTMKKGTQVQGSPITVLGTSSPIVFTLTLPPGTTNLNIYSDVDSNAVDSSTIQLSTVFNVIGPADAVIMADTLGQIMTIDKPTTTTGTCTTNINEVLTSNNIYVGATEYLGAFKFESVNCNHTITNMKFEMIGTGNVSKCLQAEVYDRNNNTFGNLIPIDDLCE